MKPVATGQIETKAVGVHVPSVLADVFETVAGAVFLDSNFCLTTVVKAYQPFFGLRIQ